MFFAVWAAVLVVLHVTDTGTPAGPTLWGGTTLLRGVLPPGATVPFGPLWFLAVYLAWWRCRRGRSRSTGGSACGCPPSWWPARWSCDVIGFGFEHPLVRWANVAFVLLLPHQLGHFYGDGSMLRRPRAVFWSMLVAGLVGSSC